MVMQAVVTASPSDATTFTATWAAMGTRVVVEVEGRPELVEAAYQRVAGLERLWSRFLPDSDVSRINEMRGLPVFVDADTRRLVRHGIAAWKNTQGACDPTVLDAVVAAGYDVSYEVLADRNVGSLSAAPAPGCAGIDVDDELGSVTVPAGVGFDPGAIGKGLAADLVAHTMRRLGATAAFVSIGGDIRTVGAPTGTDGWAIPIANPTEPGNTVATLSMSDGAVATSTTQRRRWRVGDEEHHHVIDPRTGRCATGEAISATVVAGDAWWAEAKATQLLLADPNDWPAVVGAGAGLVVDRDGALHQLGEIVRFTP